MRVADRDCALQQALIDIMHYSVLQCEVEVDALSLQGQSAVASADDRLHSCSSQILCCVLISDGVPCWR